MIQNTKHQHTNYKMIVPFIEAANNNSGYLKCTAGGYMPLVIEKLYYTDPYDNPVYSISHYGEQNGDLMADPDMTFSINQEAEKIIPLSFRNDYMGINQEVLTRIKGRLMYSSSLLIDLDGFLWHWLKNIQAQGFKPC